MNLRFYSMKYLFLLALVAISFHCIGQKKTDSLWANKMVLDYAKEHKGDKGNISNVDFIDHALSGIDLYWKNRSGSSGNHLVYGKEVDSTQIQPGDIAVYIIKHAKFRYEDAVIVWKVSKDGYEIIHSRTYGLVPEGSRCKITIDSKKIGFETHFFRPFKMEN